jgi:dipeptidyl aminopeptidase/acylaminoacyl peptidase
MAAVAAPAQATFPGANGKLAVVVEERGQGDYAVATVNPDGSDLSRLTSPPEIAYDPAWSADGSRIAFVAHAPTEQDDLFLADANGQNRVKILDAPPTPPAQPSWSPDGSSVVFSYFDLWTIGTDGGGLAHLFGDAGLNPSNSPDWSPDGTRIAFVRSKLDIFCDEEGECYFVSRSDLWVMDSDGTDAHQLTDDDGFDAAPSWSPAGRRILFTHESGLDVIDAEGGNRHTAVATRAFGGVWSPDGTKIAFQGTDGLYVMDADGRNRSLVLGAGSPGPIYRAPDWQAIPNERPDCSGVGAVPSSLWPPNGQLRGVNLSGAADPDGDAVTLGVTAVSHDEQAGRIPDWRIRDDGTVLLRADRDPRGDGRVYTVEFEVTDEHGATCTGTVAVSVPRHKHK